MNSPVRRAANRSLRPHCQQSSAVHSVLFRGFRGFRGKPPTHLRQPTLHAAATTLSQREQQADMPQPPNNDRLQGTLDLLVLKTLLRGPMHGWSVALRIQEVSREALQINQGSLYPALHRLEDAGYVRSEWGTSENNRRAKYYQLTALGKKQLAVETESWTRFTDAVGLVLRYA